MTGFLGDRNLVGGRNFGQETDAWRGPQTGLLESLGARRDVAALDKNTSGIFDELDSQRVVEALSPFSDRLYGNDQIWRIYPQYRQLSPDVDMIFQGVGQAALMPHDMAVDLLFADLNAARLASPQNWADAPKDRAAVEEQVRAALQIEHQDASRTVARDRNLPYFPDQTLKSMASELTTPRPEELPFMFLGGGSTLLGRMGASAAWGAAGEAVVHPQMQKQAEYLNTPAPNLVENMAMSAGISAAFPLAGAAFGGAMRMATAEGRAAAFSDWRKQSLPPETAGALGKAEDAIRAGDPSAAPTTPPPKPQATDDWIDAIIQQESIGDPRALGPPDEQGRRARGLMQIMPHTAREPGNGVKGLTGTDEEIAEQLFDPVKNREFGTAYFQAMLNKYEDIDTALIAYNMGPNATDKWIAAGRRYAALPKQPRDYVLAVRRHRSTQGKAAPSGPVDFEAMAARPDPTANAGGVYMPPTMRTPMGTRIDVEYEIVDLARLRAAEGDLQPRDRTRAGSREQIAHMAADLDPDLLMPSPVMSHGAPLIGPDDIVESGNGRIAAIRAAAESPETGRYAAYLDRLRDMGFELPATGQPVLIARRRTEMDDAGRRALVEEANATPVLRFSPTEQALVDAEAVPMSLLARFDNGGQIFSGEGRSFIQTMFARLPQTERAGLYSDKGGLNELGRRRIEAAVFARAYEAPDLIAALTETPDAASAGMVRALTEAAPQWASLRQGIDAGEIDPRFDLTGDLVGAVRTIAQARRDAAAQKRPVATVLDEALRQSDLERGAPSPAQRMLVEAFYGEGRARSADQAAAILKDHVEAARRYGSGGPDLFGARPPPSALEALARGAHRADAEFEPPAARADAAPVPPSGDVLGDLTHPPPSPPPRATPTPEAAMRPPEALTRYSDPESAEAVATAEAHMRELREQALADPELAGLELLDEAGAALRGADGEPMTVAKMLAEVDADEALATAVKFCGRTR